MVIRGKQDQLKLLKGMPDPNRTKIRYFVNQSVSFYDVS